MHCTLYYFSNQTVCVPDYIKLEKYSHTRETLLQSTYRLCSEGQTTRQKIQILSWVLLFTQWLSSDHSFFNTASHWDIAGSDFLCPLPSPVAVPHISCLLKHDLWNIVCSKLEKEKQPQSLPVHPEKITGSQVCSLQTLLQMLPSFG